MIERNPVDTKADFQARPLCGSYAFAIHERLTIEVFDRDLVRGEAMRWALGVLADGSYEVIGVWATPASGGWTWQDAVGDLRARGVAKIRFVSALGIEPAFSLSSRLVSMFHASEEVVRQLQRQACRAIKRSGPCVGVAAAAAIVEQALSRAEMKLGTVGTSLGMAVKGSAGARHARSRTKSVKTEALGV